jgi:hypothetical protein
MELIRDEETEEEKPISREVDLGLYNVVGWVNSSYREKDDRKGCKE